MGSFNSFIPEDVLVAIEELGPDSGLQASEPDLERSPKEFDRQVFVAKMFGDIDLAREVSSLFLSHAPQLVSAIREALANKNPKDVASAAQSLKGSVSNIGAEHVLGTVAELEQWGNSGNLTEAERTFRRLESQMESLREVLTSVSGETQPYKILIADDDPVSRRLLQAALMKWGHDPILASDGASALKLLLGANAPRMAILDWMMPGLQGVDVCRELRKRVKADYVYVILLTGKDKTDDIIEGLDAGANDYIVKPFNPQELKARVREGLRALERFPGSVAPKAEERDAFTDVLSREAILVSLKKELAQLPSGPSPVSAIMVHLDTFDVIRNERGLDEARSAFRQVADVARSLAEHGPAAGKYADDKLLLVLPGFDTMKAERLAENFKTRIAESATPAGDKGLRVTASFGVTSVLPSRGVHVEQVISAAESALRLATAKGPNHIAFVPAESAAVGAPPAKEGSVRAISRLDLELIIASRTGDLKRVSRLVSSGAQVNATDNKGNTPLMEASFFRYPEVVQLLLQSGADVSLRNNGGETALTEAVRAGHADVVELLLPRITAADLKEDAALLYKALLEASAYGKTDVVKIVKEYLLARGYIRRKRTKDENIGRTQ